MAQKKKKGTPPRTEQTKRKKVSTSQFIFMIVGVLIVLSMLISLFRF